MNKKKYLKISFVIVIISFILFAPNVYAGRGCCSHHGGVNNNKCTTDGRQVCNDDEYISNGDSCKCNPKNYKKSDLVDPDDYYGTNPYSYNFN